MRGDRRDFLRMSSFAAVGGFALLPIDRQIGQDSPDREIYACPMHPDIQSKTPGLCPKCNMRLIRSAAPEGGEYLVRIETSPRPPSHGVPTRFRFTVYHPVTGKRVSGFKIIHDQPFHLFIVSQDFESFEHIHPELQKDGSFLIETTLSKPGYYRIFCDFFPEGGTAQVTHHHLVTARYRGDLRSSMAHLVPDGPVGGMLRKSVEGTLFELQLEPSPVYAGGSFELHYRLTDERTGRPVDDLRPYLAAWGHTLILSEDGTEYLHSHPTEMLPDGMGPEERNRLVGKPEIRFETFFPRQGRYRIWSQFQRLEKLVTVSFTIDVPGLQ